MLTSPVFARLSSGGHRVSHVEIMASQAPAAFQHEATEESSGASCFLPGYHCQVGNFYGRKVGHEARNMEISHDFTGFTKNWKFPENWANKNPKSSKV